jgi:hypothetical protein
LAPLSPSIVRSDRSDGSIPRQAPTGPGGQGPGTPGSQRYAGQQPDLQRPAGPQVEQVEQVGGPGHHAGAEHDVPGPAGRTAPGRARRHPVVGDPEQAGGDDPGGRHPHQFHHAAGHLAAPQRGQVTVEALRGPLRRIVPGEVVVEPDRGGAETGDQSGGGRGRARRPGRRGQGRGDRQ